MITISFRILNQNKVSKNDAMVLQPSALGPLSQMTSQFMMPNQLL